MRRPEISLSLSRGSLRLPCGVLLGAALVLSGCGGDDGSSTQAGTETGDGDGDGDPGDGDGDPGDGDPGDGDGDPGDGDGDPGDGDGDPGDGDGDGDGDPGDGDGDPGVFALTSTAYDEGGVIPDAHTCHGANISPALAWSGAPVETQSFGLFFTDVTFNFDHSAIWNVPADVAELPEDVDKQTTPADVPGATQAESYAGWPGYAGPCPPNMHTYRWILYALDVTTLAEVDGSSSLAEVQAALEAHAIASISLDGTFTPP